MAKHVFLNASVKANSIDLSDHVESVSLDVGLETQAVMPYGGTQRYVAATGVQTVTDPVITFYQDYAPGKVYATFLALWQSQASFNLVMKPDAGAKSATNPEWTVPVLLKSMPVMTGKRGDRHMAPVTCAVAGAIAIATS